MFWMPLVGSLVMYCDSVVNGAMSQPGVEMGTAANPVPSRLVELAALIRFLAGSVSHEARLDGIRQRPAPGLVDLLQIAAHAEAV